MHGLHVLPRALQFPFAFFFLKRARAHAYLSNIEVRTLCRYDLRSSVFAIVVCGARVVLIIGFAFFVSFEGCRFMYRNQTMKKPLL